MLWLAVGAFRVRISRPKSREWIETGLMRGFLWPRKGISRPKSREWIETG